MRRRGSAGRCASAAGSTRARMRRILSMARCYPGTVMLEGTTLSEGRGTTRPLELFGAPGLDGTSLIRQMRQLAPEWLEGCQLRACWFEPTFHKHAGALCGGVQIHVDDRAYDHDRFRPWRLQALAFKALRILQPEYAALARFRLRIRARPARHRSHQRQRTAAPMGRRPAGHAGRSRRAGKARRDGLVGRAPGVPAVLRP